MNEDRPVIQLADTTGLTLASGPYKSRPGLFPMLVALGIGFAFSIVWLIVAACLISGREPQFVLYGIMVACATAAYCTYMGYVAYRLLADSKRQYVLELTQSEAVLTVIDKLHRKKSTQMVLLDDVRYAEYYPYPDSASVILHAPYTVMEVPLWPLGSQSQDVMDFLTGRGIAIVNAQFDDEIPE